MRPTLGKSKTGKPLGCVDHIIACDRSSPLFWDMTNHQALTNRCHGKKTRRFDDARGRMGTDAELQAMLEAARVRAEKIQARSATVW